MTQTASLLPGVDVDRESLHDAVSDFNIEYKVDRADAVLKNLLHFHDCYEFVYYMQSKNHAIIDDVSYNINTNDILIIPPRKIHVINYTPGIAYTRYVMYFHRTFIAPALEALGYATALDFFDTMPFKKITLSPKMIGCMGTLFDALHHQHMKKRADREHIGLLKAYSATIIGEVYRQCKRQAPPVVQGNTASLTEQVIKYINDHYAEEVTLGDLETTLYTSRYSICRTFRRETGSTLIEYLQHKRILEAQRLLQESDLSITDVAFECGFSSAQHFYRVFKKFSSATPLQFQKARRRTLRES